jgi:hypothetical protein
MTRTASENPKPFGMVRRERLHKTLTTPLGSDQICLNRWVAGSIPAPCSLCFTGCLRLCAIKSFWL